MAILCVGVMGFAIQRGATCTVAAVEEVLTERRAHRLVAMLEASLCSLSDASPLFHVSSLFAVTFVVFALWRVRPGLLVLRGPGRVNGLGQKIWAPHAATIVIGASFLVTLLLAGRWAYTDVLADLASAMGAMPVSLTLPILLLRALYIGALVGGLTVGRWKSTRVSVVQVFRCFAGGVLMGCGVMRSRATAHGPWTTLNHFGSSIHLNESLRAPALQKLKRDR